MIDFKYAHADLISLGRLIYGYLAQDIGAFSAFDGQRFAAQYLADFDATYTAARDMPSDETILDQQTIYTATIEEKMEAARKLYRNTKYFIKKAFENKPSIMNEFGANNYDDSRKSVPDMVLFLGNLNYTLNKYAAQMTTAGYNMAQANDIVTLRNELETAKYEQASFQSERKRYTQERIEKLNALYQFITETCEAGKLIYEDDMAMYAKYVLPSVATSNRPPIKTIGANSITAVYNNMVEDSFYKISNEGQVNLTFYVAANASQTVPPAAIEILSNDNRTLQGRDLGATATEKNLIVWNNTNTDGKYRIEEMS
jgi:hypothetical protein